MRARIAALDSSLIIAIAFLYLLSTLTGSESLRHVMGTVVFLTIPVFMRRLKGTPFVLSSLFMLGGILIFIATDSGYEEWIAAANMNVTLVTLFVFAPLFGIPIRANRYTDALKQLYQSKFKSKLAFFTGSQIMTQLIAIFVNVGSISIMYNLIAAHPAAKNIRFLSAVLNRGFSGAMLWSPYFAGMALMTSQLGASWTEIVPWVLLLAIGSIVISVLVEFKELMSKNENIYRQEDKTPGSGNSKVYVSLVLYLLLTMSSVLLLEQVVTYTMVIIICISAIVFPFIWSALTKDLGNFKEGIKHHLSAALPSMHKEITLFLAAGFIGGAIKNINLGAGYIEMLDIFTLPLPLVFAVTTMLIIIAAASLGLHPIVLVTIVASTISPEDVGVSANFMAVLLLGSWSISNPISPVSAVNNILASLTSRSLFELAKYNFRFTIAMGLFILGYLLLFVQ